MMIFVAQLSVCDASSSALGRDY